MENALCMVVIVLTGIGIWAYASRPWWTWLRLSELQVLFSYPLAGPERRRWFRGLMHERQEADLERRIAALPPASPAKEPRRRPAVRADWHLSGHFTRGIFTASFEAGSLPAEPKATSTRYEAAPPGVAGDIWEQVRTGRISRDEARARFRAPLQDLSGAQRDIDRAVREVHRSVEEAHRAAADMARRVASGELSERRLTMYPDPLDLYFAGEHHLGVPPRGPRRPQDGTPGGRQW